MLHLESLTNKAVEKLPLDVDEAGQARGEEFTVHQHLDHFSCNAFRYVEKTLNTVCMTYHHFFRTLNTFLEE